ncbi:hypothetical protein ACIBK9_28785 [Nonomuraea sp. NPDC050227]|uniref:hypothetical protein n=1 Tax=Nonomuraea sp. NPDC050227 TaxID=3364360 RepID=UPI0037A0E8E2
MDRPPSAGSFEPVDVTPPGCPIIILWFDPAARELVIPAGADSRLSAHLTVRYTRILLRLMAAAYGGAFLHAGLVHAGRGVAVLGGKRAGKTSTILAALQHGATFVSNDDLSVHRVDGGWWAQGWPRAVSVRGHTFTALGMSVADVLREQGWSLEHPESAGIELPAADSDERIVLYPHELTALCGAPMAGAASLDTLVFPSFGPGPARLLPLTPAQTAALLRHNLLPVPVKDADFLLACFPPATPEAVADELHRLAHDLSGFALEQSFTALYEGAVLLQNLLRGST